MHDTRADALATEWQIDALLPFAQTATARLWRGQHRGRDVVLKVFSARGHEEIAGARLLAAWNGVRAAEVLALAPDAILMEHLAGPDLATLVREGRDAEATAILVDCAKPRVVADLPADLHPLPQWLRPLFAAPPGVPVTVTRAAPLAHVLLQAAARPVPLHGDLHHENILSCPRGWAAIDPKGLLGNIGFEVAPAFRNPLRIERVTHKATRINMLADSFSASLEMPRQEVLQWAIVGNAISAVWDINAGNDPSATLRLLSHLWAATDDGAPD